MSEERLAKVIIALRNSFTQIAEELNDILDKMAPGQVKQTQKKLSEEFDPENLMKHEWKGKKLGPGEYAPGSISYGWDFRENFALETIMALENGPITIDKYEFTLLDRIVQVKEKKRGKG